MSVIVVGDVHGCLEELRQLLYQCDYDRQYDRVIFVGDLVDRGPDPRGVVNLVQDMKLEGVKGNHEEKLIRWRKHEAKKKLNPKHKNPMQKPHPDRQVQWESFTDEEIAYLDSLPDYLMINEQWVVVHAGLRPALPLNKQHPNELQRMRYVRLSDGGMAPLSEELKPETHSYWTDLWKGPQSVVFGHHVFDSGPVLTKTEVPGSSSVYTIGVDTGCCFGMSLTAVILNFHDSGELKDLRFKSVKASKSYAPRPSSPTE